MILKDKNKEPVKVNDILVGPSGDWYRVTDTGPMNANYYTVKILTNESEGVGFIYHNQMNRFEIYHGDDVEQIW